MKEDDSDDWKKLASVGAFDTAYTAKNLKTGKQYKFAVAAENKIGRGELSELGVNSKVFNNKLII
jgi:hypothetical protein